MAKYNVKHSCGHEQEIELFGKVSERERRIAWLEEQGTCKECWRKEQEEKQPFAEILMVEGVVRFVVKCAYSIKDQLKLEYGAKWSSGEGWLIDIENKRENEKRIIDIAKELASKYNCTGCERFKHLLTL